MKTKKKSKIKNLTILYGEVLYCKYKNNGRFVFEVEASQDIDINIDVDGRADTVTLTIRRTARPISDLNDSPTNS